MRGAAIKPHPRLDTLIPDLIRDLLRNKKKQQDMEQQVKYEEAMRQLEEIVEKIENNELDIDQLTSQLKKAKELITLCKDKLVKTDEELKKILEE